MKSYRKELWFNIPARRKIVRITDDVQKAIDESGIKEGLVLVNAMNITASVFINDDESGLHSDYERWLEKLAPEKPYSQYDHNGFEDNADAHLKRTIMGREVVCAITNGRLDFGTWEQIFYYVGVLAPFGIGVIVGIFAVAKLIEWLFAKFPSVTYCGILGLIVASPIAIVMKMSHNNINLVTISIGIILFVAGTWFTYWFGKKTEE
jgi:secondary thiamine-phosphate synthase enzyme